MSPSRETLCRLSIGSLKINPIAKETLTQPSRYNRVENNLLSDEKFHRLREPGSCLVINIYTIDLFFKERVLTFVI